MAAEVAKDTIRGLGLLGRSGMVKFFSHGDNRALRRRGRLPVEKCNSPDQRIAARCILLTKLVAKMEIRASCSLVNMLRPRSAGQILLALTLCSSCAIDAYGWSSASFLHPSIRQEETTMSFVAWVVLGLAAGFIGSQLVNRSGKSIMPDVLLEVVGAVTGGWSFYAFGPLGVNGFGPSWRAQWRGVGQTSRRQLSRVAALGTTEPAKLSVAARSRQQPLLGAVR